MFRTLNARFNAGKIRRKENRFILESVLDVDEVLPGSEEELEDVTDVDSVPDDAYKKIDAALDKIVDDPNYDDTEAEELLDDDIDEGNIAISDEDLDAVITEAANCMVCGGCAWKDDENIGHPNTARRNNQKQQPFFRDTHDEN